MENVSQFLLQVAFAKDEGFAIKADTVSHAVVDPRSWGPKAIILSGSFNRSRHLGNSKNHSK